MPTSSEQAVVSVNAAGKCYHVFRSPGQRVWSALTGSAPGEEGAFWAVQDVSFALAPGECVGVVGRNGAGKSTLLQLIAGIVKPTCGRVEVRGRVAALLELGAGFNPDFTGRENIRLNAAILGLSAAAIETRIEDIIAFADIGPHIDQPVRTYSSGMYVRVAFAVQVHIDPDLLIVDEALAVGDAAFQVKCFRRLRHLQESGMAILLVSHDVQSIRMLCKRALWLEQGRLKMDGDAAEVTANYMRTLFGGSDPSAIDGQAAAEPAKAADAGGSAVQDGEAGLYVDLAAGKRERWGDGGIRIESLRLASSGQMAPDVFMHGAALTLRIRARVEHVVAGWEPSLAFAIKHRRGMDLITDTTYCHGIDLGACRVGELISADFSFANILAPEDYELVVAVEDRGDGERRYLDFVEGAAYFKVISDERVYSLVKPPVTLSVNRVGHV